MNEYIQVLKKYAVFTGRSGRREYWMFVLWNVIISIALMLIEFLLFKSDVYVLRTIYAIVVLLPSLGVTMRRLHDINKSGWFILLGLIPLVGPFILIYFAVQESQPGDNQYGPNPFGSSTANPISDGL